MEQKDIYLNLFGSKKSPFAFFLQIFFIQPTVRAIFKWIFVRNNEENYEEYTELKALEA